MTRDQKLALIQAIVKIDNKEGLVLPLIPNRMQRYFHYNKANRNIILKHRQGGFSTFYLADMFTDCLVYPNDNCAVISHETRATQRLLDRVNQFYKRMDDPKPKLDIESRSELKFEDLNSGIYVGTAGSKAFGRGDTIKKAHLSEYAFYENARVILNGVEDAVPLTGEITLECSPNGEDTDFYEQWVRAREGKSPYKPFFFPWWWSDDYRIEIGSELALECDRGELVYTVEEQELVGKYELCEAQIRWRRYKIAEKQGLFWQEYPEDEVSCFIVIGDPVFDTELLNTMAQSCYEGQKHQVGWTFWRPLDPKMRYIIGADTSAGAPGGSFSAAAVIDSNYNVVATYQARVEPHVFAGILKQMGRYYNNATLAVERNFTGYAVLGHLNDYPNIYYQRDYLSGKITSNKGWWTNDQTRNYLFSATKEMLQKVNILDMNLVRQLRSFRYIKYRPTAQTFDDLAIAFMIAMAVKKTSGVAQGYQGSVAGWSW
jgi:hypothetical protein